MTNADISDVMKLYADLMELHGTNSFKAKSYSVASFRIDKMTEPLAGLPVSELEKVEGIGKSLAGKIAEVCVSGSFAELDELMEATPAGVREMMRVKGIGPKKISFLWKELGIDTVGELLYACRENRIAQAKGFGLKTQQSIIKQIEFMLASAEKFHYARIEEVALTLLAEITAMEDVRHSSLCGDVRRKCDVCDHIEIIAAVNDPEAWKEVFFKAGLLAGMEIQEDFMTGKIMDTIPVTVHICQPGQYHRKLLIHTGSEEHIAEIGAAIPEAGGEDEIYKILGMDYIEPEMREGRGETQKAKTGQLPRLIEVTDLRGILHNHSTYSDGADTLEVMATACRDLGYEYLGICDHSRAAFYAQGMSEEEIVKQHAEIDQLNQKLAPFKIFKGIESDILNDGSLDYSNEVLASFDFIVASIHSNLKMSEEKAMLRLMKAIENPYTTILGHPTGRLLLMREGYPIDHEKIIDACAANGVVIEINANPYRLDLDWRWIDYAMNKGVKLSINPDAHEKEGYQDMYYGVCSARKGGLTKEMCLNALGLEAIELYFRARKK
jgi:DNA polymerase (family 10)